MTTKIDRLIDNFNKNDISSIYNETQTRTDFITPLLKVLGWDVNNSEGLPNEYREVIEEAQLKTKNQDTKRPDYELRVGRIRKLFVEAKKPSINIDIDPKSAFQARRYGYSAGLPITILTNFKHTAIYDTTVQPKANDEAYVARIELISVDELSEKFNLLSKYLSRQNVSDPNFFSKVQVKKRSKQEKSFDEHFLEKIKEWRIKIATDLYTKDSNIDSKSLTHFTQQIISRLIFLRICEDRDIEKFESLLSCSQSGYSEVIKLIKESDYKYKSGLFDIFKENDNTFNISDNIIKNIIEELYYPNSPYSFSVLETEILGGIYDQFLCEELYLDNDIVKSIYKPEYRDAGGVVNTPRHIVDHMVNDSVSNFSKLNIESLREKRVLDTCCGSGVFLISTFEHLMEVYLNTYKENTIENLGKKIIKVNDNNYKLTFEAKSEILLDNIFGVDIDPESVELAKLGLYLKLLEGENSIPPNSKLPNLNENLKCGNSLISDLEWDEYKDSIDYYESLNFFNWGIEFKKIMSNGGFDLIIGNPPYVRIQKLKKYSLNELNFYHSKKSPYYTANRKDIDKYFIFIERSMSLISENGLVSLIVPNKFISNQYGELLREYITQSKMLRSIINFGSIHVFKGKALNYTCIVNLSKSSENKVTNNRVSDINDWVQNNTVKSTTYPEEVFSSKPWIFPSQDVSKIIQKCQKRSSQTLGDIADIYVGLQTSADNIYVIKEEKQDTDYIYFKKEGITYHVEKEILKPFILDLPLHPFTQPKNNSWLIFPYEQSNGESKVYSEELMKSRFPNAYKYLLANKSALVERSITGGKKVDQVWYQFGRSQSLNKMDREKIILPVQSKTYRYTPDINGIYLTGGGNGPYYLISPKSNNISIHLLLAILNNEISESQVKLCTSIIGNGYYAHNKEFIENLLIPKMSEQEKLDIESISKKIISLTNELEYSKSHKRTILVRSIQSQKEKLNQIIISLFGLSNDEFDILKSVSPE